MSGDICDCPEGPERVHLDDYCDRCHRFASAECRDAALRRGLRFRKRPVVVEAFQMTEHRRGDNSGWPSWLHEAWQREHDEPGALFPERWPNSDGKDRLVIHTLEGNHLVEWGDWIIRGVKGELYPCKPDIFAATYEQVPTVSDLRAGDMV